MRRGREREQGDALFHVFNVNEESGGGFVIIAGDNAARPVLGYSPNGKFDENNLPPGFAYWLEYLGGQIEWAQDNNVEQSEEVRREWEGAAGTAENNSFVHAPMAVVGPLIQTLWGQGWPFNNMTPQSPLHDGQRAYTGCDATAIAQVMKFHNHPVRGTGQREAYTAQGGAINVPSVDFSATVYDWENMLNVYTESATAAQQNAVATLMYHIGVSARAQYASHQGTLQTYLPGLSIATLSTHFGYNEAAQWLRRSDYSNDSWETILREQLDYGLPMFYGGWGDGPDKPGHGFVCDGYDNTGKFHFNFGWNGSADGFYVTTALNTSPGYDFNRNQNVIINLFPVTEAFRILAAKTRIEGTLFGPVPQSDVNTQPAARARVESVIAGLSLSGVSAVVTDVNFEAAFAGTAGNPSGMDGYYNFTVALSIGGEQQVTRVLELVITATPFNAEVVADNADITATKALIERTAFGPAAQSGGINTLAAARGHVESVIAGLNMNGVSAAVINGDFEAAFAGTVGNPSGMDGYYTFTVELNKGTGRQQVTRVLELDITAAPHGDAAMIYNAEIAAAKALIERTEFGPAPQSEAIDMFVARNYIEGVLATLNLNGVTAMVVTTRLEPAFAGTFGNPRGMDGWYNFTVTLSKSLGTQQITDVLELPITATPYQETSILSPDRAVPPAGTDNEAAVVAPVIIQSGQFTAGPNPVDRQSSVVNFYREGRRINGGKLTVFDAAGNVVNRVGIKDGNDTGENNGKRVVGSWDLTDKKGRTVPAGTYLLRGTVTTSSGNRERVSVILGVR
jgi:hypothetical protein